MTVDEFEEEYYYFLRDNRDLVEVLEKENIDILVIGPLISAKFSDGLFRISIGPGGTIVAWEIDKGTIINERENIIQSVERDKKNLIQIVNFIEKCN